MAHHLRLGYLRQADLAARCEARAGLHAFRRREVDTGVIAALFSQSKFSSYIRPRGAEEWEGSAEADIEKSLTVYM